MANEPQTMDVTITRGCIVNGKPVAIGSHFTLPIVDGNYLVSLNKAVEGHKKVESKKEAAKETAAKK